MSSVNNTPSNDILPLSSEEENGAGSKFVNRGRSF